MVNWFFNQFYVAFLLCTTMALWWFGFRPKIVPGLLISLLFILCLITPRLVLFLALAAILVSALSRRFERDTSSSLGHRPGYVVLSAIILGAITFLTVFLLLFPHGGGSNFQQVSNVVPTITVPYQGTAEFHDAKWSIVEYLTLDKASIKNFENSSLYQASRRKGPASVVQAIHSALEERGWRFDTIVDGDERFRRSRSIIAIVPRFIGSSTTLIPLGEGLGEDPGVVEIAPARESSLTVIAPFSLVGATTPPGDKASITGTREQHRVRLEGGEGHVEIQLLSPVLRNALGRAITQLMALGWFGILLTVFTTVLALGRDEIKRQLLEPLVGRLSRGLRMVLQRRSSVWRRIAKSAPRPSRPRRRGSRS